MTITNKNLSQSPELVEIKLTSLMEMFFRILFTREVGLVSSNLQSKKNRVKDQSLFFEVKTTTYTVSVRNKTNSRT